MLAYNKEKDKYVPYLTQHKIQWGNHILKETYL